MKKYIPKTSIGKKLSENKRYRIILFAGCGLIINLLYALYNGILGITSGSIWFINLCAYYIILSIMRFGTVISERRNVSKDYNTEAFVMKFCGVMLIVLAFVLSGSVCLSLTNNVAVKHQETVMITIATYTFYKIILSIVNAVKVRKEKSHLLSTIRNIGCADAAISVLSLQRSMLVSFGNDIDRIYSIMVTLTGMVIFLFIVLMGVSMILKGRED